MDARTVRVPGPMLIGSGVALYFSALCNAYLNVDDGGFIGDIHLHGANNVAAIS